MNTPNLRSEKGQIIVLLAVGIVILLGFVALAIDGGMVFFDRRSAQNAADASALAGGYELAQDPWTTVTLRERINTAAQGLASDNQYGEDSGKIVKVELLDAAKNPLVKPTPLPNGTPVPDNAGLTRYVRVTITSSVNTSFLHFVYPGPVLNTVQSVAKVQLPVFENPFTGSGLVALAPHACSGLYLSGNLKGNLIGGGVFVNSDNATCAVDGPGGSFSLYTPTMDVVGTISSKVGLGTNLLVYPGPSKSPDPTGAVPYPPVNFPEMPICTEAVVDKGIWTAAAFPDLTTPPDAGTVTYEVWGPGASGTGYFPAGTGFPNGNVYFERGIYCFSIPNTGNGSGIGAKQYVFNDPAHGVLLVFTGDNPCGFNINAGATIELTGYQGNKTYNNLLIYVDPRKYQYVTTNLGEKTFIFNGTQGSYIKGTVFAPTCSVNLNGTGGNMYQGQMIGYDLTLSGTTGINMLYISGDNIQVQYPSKIDLYK